MIKLVLEKEYDIELGAKFNKVVDMLRHYPVGTEVKISVGYAMEEKHYLKVDENTIKQYRKEVIR